MSKQALAVKEDAPLLLRRIREISKVPPIASKRPDGTGKLVMCHFTVCTTPGNTPEMHDQWEDQYR